jgi:hypothetical protein
MDGDKSVMGWRMMPDDRTIKIDGSLEGLASIAAATPSREAILEAAEPWRTSKTSAARCIRNTCMC